MNGSPLKKQILRLSSYTFLACIVMSWMLYTLFGHYLIEIIYRSEWIIDIVMKQRTVTPLKDYYQAADHFMVLNSFRVVVLFLFLVVLIYNPIGAIFLCFSSLLCVSLLFILLEFFPSFVNLLHLDVIDYYAYRQNYIADNELAYREKPLVSTYLPNFRGSRYSPVYKIDVIPKTIEWVTNENGFRNSYVLKSADVLVIGDSFTEYGDNEADTFGKRLERNLSGLTVANLGKAGYGPFQYLEVFKRYGVNKNPKIALFCFFEGNDIDDIEEYLAWQKGDSKGAYGKPYTALTANLSERYVMTLMGTIRYIKKQINLLVGLSVSEIWEIRGYIHPDVAVLNVGNKNYKMLLDFKIKKAQSTDELLKTNGLRQLREILRDFKAISEQYSINPIILYIPTQAHIYAEYSTPQSGSRWKKLRPERIHVKKNVENAIVKLSQELNLELINLSPAFEQAAKDGKVLYYALDSHWNKEGREVAASFVAEKLIEKFRSPSSGELKQ